MAQNACIPLSLTPTPVDAAAFGQDASLAASGGTGLDLVQIANSSAPNLPNGAYQAWCGTHYNDPVNAGNLNGPAYMASTNGTGPNNTNNGLFYTSPVVNEINYILNNKIGTVLDVQEAIWLVIDQSLTNPPAIPPAFASANATTMYNNAVTNGQTFVPFAGQRVAVFLFPLDATPANPDQNLIIEMVECGQIGDRVWFDSNNNGLQDFTIVTSPTSGFPTVNYTEPGINGVTVQLKDTGGHVLATTVTGPSPANYPYLPPGTTGYYQFTGLQPGATYQVFIDNTQAALSGYGPTLAQQGSDATADSNPNPYTDTLPNLNPGIDETVDFGYITQAVPPLNLTCAASTGQVNVPYSSSIAVTGGVGPYTFSISAGALPGGLTLNPLTGLISGTPTTAGPFSFTAQVVDSSGTANNTKTASCGITIGAALSVACASATTGQVNVPYNSALTASGGMGPYTYSIASGNLPTGLTLNPTTGAITGTPTAFGTFSFTAKVTDSSGNSASNTATSSCSITIAPPPVQVTCPYATGVMNVAYSSSAPATGGTGSYTWSVTAGALPAGLILNTSTGAVTGTPTASGAYSFTIQAKDSQNNAGSASCGITIAAPPLVVSCASTTTATLNAAITPSAAQAAGGSGTGYTFSISAGALPSGVTINPSTGVISGTPTSSGTFSYTVKVTDSLNNSATTSCSLLVVTPPITLTCGINTALAGTAYSSSIGASGGTGSYTYSVSSGALPGGLTLNPATGVISGNPTTAGSFSFTIKVTDSGNNSQTTNCTITVTTPVTVSCIGGVGQVGQAYVSAFVASGGTGPYTYSISSGALPAGLTLNPSTGSVTGVPTTAGTFTFTVKAVNSTRSTAGAGTSNCSVVVASAPPPIDLECGSCGANKTSVGKSYTSTLTVSGAKAPYTFSVLSGTLPPGLTLNPSTGVISGTATTAGTFTFTTKVVDANSSTDTATCTITVTGIPANLQCGSCGSSNGTVGTAYTSTLSATGGSGAFTYSIASGSLPPGLTLNATTGAISGSPTTAGSYTFTSKAADQAGDTDTATCTIIIVNPTIDLQCGACGSNTAFTGSSYSSALTMVGGKASFTYSISSGSLPPGVTLNSSTGVISGTPNTPGTYTFTSKVVDANGSTDTATCTITVQGQPVNLLCGTCGNNNAKVGTAYSAALSVTGGKANFAYAISSGSLPPGLSLNSSTGVISGTPSTAGTYNFTSKVVDANGSVDTASCTIVVTGQSSSINLDCGSCGAGKATVGAAYSAQYTVTGGSSWGGWGWGGGTSSYSIVSGSLPPGLHLNSSSGVISGTPTAAGSYTFTAKVVDSQNDTDTQACTIVVTGTPVNLDCGACGQSYASVGTAFTATESLTGGTAPYVVSLLSGQLPPGLTLNASSGVISGTPTTAGTYTFTTKVIDHNGGTDTATCTIVVANSAMDLECGTCGNNKVYTGAAYSAQFNATGGNGHYTYSISSGSLPAGLTLNSSTGAITGAPTTAGSYTFTSKAVDGNGKSDTATCTIVVTGTPVDLSCGSCGAAKATVGTPYSVPVSQTGGAGPFSYSITSGSLPPGVTLNASTGALSGTPTTAGNYTFTEQVVDANHSTDTATCTIQVVTVPLILECGTCGQNKTSVGASYSVTLSATGGSGGYTYSILNGSLPAGLSLNTSTGVVSGKPSVAGNYSFTTKVTDSHGSTDTSTCSIVVSGGAPCGQYVTYTQSDWGSSPGSSNVGQLLQSCWGQVYTTGYLQIGGSNELKFTSNSSIDSFLPSGGNVGTLNSSGTNVTSCSGGTFAGEVLALQLNCDFSSKGVTPAGFSNLHVCSGPWAGQTVAQVLSLANSVLGGATWQLPGGLGVSDLSNLVNSINGNFQSGRVNCGVLQ